MTITLRLTDPQFQELLIMLGVATRAAVKAEDDERVKRFLEVSNLIVQTAEIETAGNLS
jgi:hypothetical protein